MSEAHLGGREVSSCSKVSGVGGLQILGQGLTVNACGLSLINAEVFRGVVGNNLSLVNHHRRKEWRGPLCACQDFHETKGAELCMLRGVLGPLISSRGPILSSKALLIINHAERLLS